MAATEYAVRLTVDASGVVTGIKTATGEAVKLETALSSVARAGGSTSASFAATGKAAVDATDKVNRQSRALGTLGQVFNDSQQFAYGFRSGLVAISNQIPQLIELIGATGKAGQRLQMSLGWISLALSAATTAFVLLGNRSKETTNAINDQTDAWNDLNKAIQTATGAQLAAAQDQAEQSLRAQEGYVRATRQNLAQLEAQGRAFTESFNRATGGIDRTPTREYIALQAQLAAQQRTLATAQVLAGRAAEQASNDMGVANVRLRERIDLLATNANRTAAQTAELARLRAEEERNTNYMNAGDPAAARQAARQAAAADRRAEREAIKAENEQERAAREAAQKVVEAEAARRRVASEAEASARIKDETLRLQGATEEEILEMRLARAEAAHDAEMEAFGQTTDLYRDLSQAAQQAENDLSAERKRLRMEDARADVDAAEARFEANTETLRDEHALALSLIEDESARERRAIEFERAERQRAAESAYQIAKRRAALIEDEHERRRALAAALADRVAEDADAERDELIKTAELDRKLREKQAEAQKKAHDEAMRLMKERFDAVQRFVDASVAVMQAMMQGEAQAAETRERRRLDDEDRRARRQEDAHRAEMRRIDAALEKEGLSAEAKKKLEADKAAAESTYEAAREDFERRRMAAAEAFEQARRRMMREQAVAEKRMAIFQIALQTAVNIVTALRGGNVFAAVAAGAIGAAQAVAVERRPLPALNRGGIVPGSGADRDSTLAYLTPGEAVITRRSVGPNSDIIAAMNARPGERVSSGGAIDYDRLGAAVARSMRSAGPQFVPVLRDRDAAAAMQAGAREATITRGGAAY